MACRKTSSIGLPIISSAEALIDRIPYPRYGTRRSGNPGPDNSTLQTNRCYTPKQGRRLNIAAFELSTMSGRCLDRRISARETLERELAAGEAKRNARGGPVN